MLPIVTALPPLPSPLSASNMKPFELQQPYNHIQCDVAKIALYSLPSNLRLDSIDFEQCILDCVTNKFLTDQKSSTSSLSSSSSSAISQNGLSKRMVSEIPIYPKLYDPSSSSSSPSSLNYTVAIHSKKLWWNVWDSSECPPIDIRDSNNSMRLSFTKIQLCYVNHRMPDLIIWLFFSLPKVSEKDSLKTLSPSSSTSKRLQFKSNRNNSLFALVWKCFNEQDVVHLREVYKHLQSMPSNLKQTKYHQSMLTFEIFSQYKYSSNFIEFGGISASK
ncbi:hypothetical protein NH340_JMT00469 [Sarcoptes scabiei]|nr:hypothetical protein NH340_JMT00469 [Sarcoptes scabiei]